MAADSIDEAEELYLQASMMSHSPYIDSRRVPVSKPNHRSKLHQDTWQTKQNGSIASIESHDIAQGLQAPRA